MQGAPLPEKIESYAYLCLYAFDLSQAFDMNFRSGIFFRSPERKVIVPNENYSKQDQKRSYNKSGINKGFSHPALPDPIKKWFIFRAIPALQKIHYRNSSVPAMLKFFCFFPIFLVRLSDGFGKHRKEKKPGHPLVLQLFSHSMNN